MRRINETGSESRGVEEGQDEADEDEEVIDCLGRGRETVAVDVDGSMGVVDRGEIIATSTFS